MAKCPYCKGEEFVIDRIQVSGNGSTVSVKALVCKQCSSLLSLVDITEEQPKPFPPDAFIKA